MIAEELTPEALRAARIAALAAFYATEDDGDEAQEMADTMEFDDQGEGE